RSQALRKIICRRIEHAGGWISFEEFMQLALHEPGLGYYAGGPAQPGSRGDFTTAPELGSLFAQCLARFAKAAIADDERRIIEIGAGSGKMLRDMAGELTGLGVEGCEYLTVDTSARLTRMQDETLAEVAGFRRLNELPQNFQGLIIANEVLDALPCRVLRREEDGWRQRGVAVDEDGSFVWQSGPEAAAADSRRLGSRISSPGYETEINRQAEALVTSLCECLTDGVLLIIDYGFAAAEYYHPQRSYGTLRSYRQHRVTDDVLARAGECDLTAHIDFSAIATAAGKAGAQVHGFTTQAAFLLGCSFDQVFARATAATGDDQRSLARLSAEAQTLLMPQEMGETFKVLALVKGAARTLPGFCQADRSERLDA
ncbi:MAG: SAM-dependent methyltransferase, partial [Betaproteobacteria bacterium]|nr:SAM-dependent methyltransferase [Betaproteobacteria bacterium]